jgi:hypothetical protein
VNEIYEFELEGTRPLCCLHRSKRFVSHTDVFGQALEFLWPVWPVRTGTISALLFFFYFLFFLLFSLLVSMIFELNYPFRTGMVIGENSGK